LWNFWFRHHTTWFDAHIFYHLFTIPIEIPTNLK
jgi:hypothetical protein